MKRAERKPVNNAKAAITPEISCSRKRRKVILHRLMVSANEIKLK